MLASWQYVEVTYSRPGQPEFLSPPGRCGGAEQRIEPFRRPGDLRLVKADADPAWRMLPFVCGFKELVVHA